MKKWLALLMILLLGVGTSYADELIVNLDNGDSITLFIDKDNSGSVDDVNIYYDNSTGNISITGSYTGQINITIKNSTGDVVFSSTISVSGNISITIKKTNNGWVIVTPTKAPIPPIAIALTLIAIPIIALRRCS
jgi:hypothetical protein